MPQSLAQILVHLVFSTKNRAPLLDPSLRPELHAYFGGIINHLHGTLLRAGSVSDHVHLLLAHPRTSAPAELVQEIKTGSSKWLKNRRPMPVPFHWQNGYGMFSVSASQRAIVEAYLNRQEEHHRKLTFQDEYRRLLRNHGVDHDERYVWD